MSDESPLKILESAVEASLLKAKLAFNECPVRGQTVYEEIIDKLVRHVKQLVSDYSSESLDEEEEEEKEGFTSNQTEFQPSDDIKQDLTITSNKYKLKWEIIGNEEAKRALEESLMWRNSIPQLKQFPILSPPTGILLYGCPGVGKTKLIEEASKQSGAKIITVKASQIKSKWYGESEKEIEKIFTEARKWPLSVIFIDEIEAITPKRTEQKDCNDIIVTELLRQMDKLSFNVQVIGATNHLKKVDPAIQRRFEGRILIDIPNSENRKEIFKQILPPDLHSINEEGFEQLSQYSDGLTGSDIKSVARKAARSAVRMELEKNSKFEGPPKITLENIMKELKTYRSPVTREMILAARNCSKSFSPGSVLQKIPGPSSGTISKLINSIIRIFS